MVLTSNYSFHNLFGIILLTLFISTSTQFNILPNARWSQNAITVAGSWSGQGGGSLNRLFLSGGLHIADDGTLYIADTSNNRIILIRPNSTTPIVIIGDRKDSNSFQLSEPTDIFVTKTNMYVVENPMNSRVLQWQINSSNPNTIYGSPQGIIDVPRSSLIFVDRDAYLYVSDASTNTVIRIPLNSSNDTNYVIVAGNGIGGSTLEQFMIPLGIFVDAVGTVYVADNENHRIQKWTTGASFGVTVAGNGRCDNDSVAQICFPTSVIVDSNGFIYTVDNVFARIVRWAPNSTSGECIAACSGKTGLQPDRLFAINEIGFDDQGSIYVNDYQNNRVQKFQILAYVNQTSAINTTTQSTNIILSAEQTTASGSTTALIKFTAALYHMITIMILWTTSNLRRSERFQ